MATHPKPHSTRTVGIRAYQHGVPDLRRTYRAPADADMAEFLKRSALAALPKYDGWHLLVVSMERTKADEAIAPILDWLARRLLGSASDVAAALAMTGDGARAVLAVTANDAKQIARLRAALSVLGRR